jgi:D-amino peptidase
MRRVFSVLFVALLAASPLPAQQRGVRVLLLHDMEGLTSQDDWREISFGYPEQYAKGRQKLLDDVNATIEGLVAGGASKIDVVDGHGSGNPEPDLMLDKMDKHAQMIYRDRPFDPYIDMQEAGKYDAVVLVGMHGKPGSGGFLAHTYTGGMEFWMNDMSLSEPEIIGYSWGRVNVPVVYVAGDEVLCRDLKSTMSWIECVATKRGTSASTAVLFPADSVRANMRSAAKRSLENLSKMKTMKMQGPVKTAMHARPPGSLAALDSVPGINYSDNTVSFQAADFEHAYRGILSLINVAGQAAALNTMRDALRQQPNGTQMMQVVSEFRMNRWLDAESGRWKPPVPIPPEIQNAGKKFFGDR